MEQRPRLRPVRMGRMRAETRTAPDGTVYVRSLETLSDYPRTITDRLRHWAETTPDAIFLADRGENGEWRRVSYAQAWTTVRSLAQSLLPYRLSPEHPLLILGSEPSWRHSPISGFGPFLAPVLAMRVE